MKPRTLTTVLLSLLLVVFVVTGCKSSTSSTGSAATTVSTATGTSTDSTSSTASAASTESATASCPSSNTTGFAKTKFVLHTGLAFGAFHRYIYKPYKAGTFQSGAHGRLTGFIKAGAAALFVKREVRLAYADATANPTLCKAIAAPLQSIGDKIESAVTKLKGGDASGVTDVENSIQSTETQSAATGNTIQEDPNAPLS